MINMIEKIIIDENISILKTNKQFILVIHDEIYGPFENEDAKNIYNFFKNIETQEER